MQKKLAKIDKMWNVGNPEICEGKKIRKIGCERSWQKLTKFECEKN